MKLNPYSCVQLFELALSRGFTTTHSFLMLNAELDLLREAHFVMESMNKFSQKQLDFTSLMLTIKPIHDHLVKEGGLISDFGDNVCRLWPLRWQTSEPNCSRYHLWHL